MLFAPGPRQSVEELAVTRSAVVATIYDNVRGRAVVFTPEAAGWRQQRLALPENASVDIYTSETRGGAALIGVESFLAPTTVWLADTAAGSAVQVRALAPRFDASGLVTEQFEAASKDGTKIPYFVTHRRDVQL